MVDNDKEMGVCLGEYDQDEPIWETLAKASLLSSQDDVALLGALDKRLYLMIIEGYFFLISH